MSEDSRQSQGTLVGPDGESLLKFPDTFHIKAMGKNDPQLLDHIQGIIARHAQGLPDDAFQCRESRDGNYLSVTCSLMAQSREQLDAIYKDLSADEKVIIAL